MKTKGWPGIHSHPGTLTSAGTGVPFRCTACDKVCKWPGAGHCPKARKSSKPLPTTRERRDTWNAWLKVAIAFAKAEALKLRKARKPTATLAYAQAKQRSRNWNGASTQPIRKLHSGLQYVTASGSGDWWKCQWCDFSIPQSSASSCRRTRRKEHLQQVHGLTEVPHLPTGDPLTNPHRLQRAQKFYDRRWATQHEIFQNKKWKGAHDFDATPALFRPSTTKHGKTIVLTFHQCFNCQLLSTRSLIPLRTCPVFKGKPASLAVRKQVWKARRAEAMKRLSKESDGEAATTRGLRAKRIGDSLPGPSQAVTMWSQNLRSWRTNGYACLERAQAAGVSLVALQEMNLRATAVPSVINACVRKGWHMIQVSPPANTSNRGGVSICCRESLGLVPLEQWSSSLGQFVLVEVHGANRPFKLFCYYRHADDVDLQGLSRITQILSTDTDHSWVVAMDANMNQMDGVCFNTMTEIGGSCRAHAGHNSSRFPIDGIWSSHDMLATTLQSIRWTLGPSIVRRKLSGNRILATWTQLGRFGAEMSKLGLLVMVS